MSRFRRWPWMTLAWLAMGGIVTAGFVVERRDDQKRCQGGNEFRRDQRAAFAEYSQLLGRRLGATQQAIDEAIAEFDEVLLRRFPERDCPLW